MSRLIELMEKKLDELEKEFHKKIGNYPTRGHGGTPFIIDNSKGRAMMKAKQKYDEGLKRLDFKIKEQKEKIESQKRREQIRNTPTKKAQKFIDRNPISPLLIEFEKEGIAKPWKRNPYVFFIVGVEKVAVITVGKKVGFSKAYYPTNEQKELDVIKEVVARMREENE